MLNLMARSALTLLLSILSFVVLTAGLQAEPAGAAGGRNRVVLEIPPGPGNARNSEGSFLTLKDGRILFIYSRFVGESNRDEGKAVLAARTSADEGENWSNDTIIATPGEAQAMNVMSVSLMRMQNGDVGLFYMLRSTWHDLRMLLRRSHDEGRTWSDPVQCMAASEYYVVNNDRVLRLASGRLIIPAAFHRKLSDREEESAIDNRAVALFFLSDDDGRTWRESATACALNTPHTQSGLQEPGVVELPNGDIWAWARTDQGRQYEFFSSDGGETWTEPRPSRFTSPQSPLSMRAVPGTKQLLAIWNPIPNYQTRPLTRPARDRTPLVGAMGEGLLDATWSAPFLVDENNAMGEGYAYVAIHFTGKSVLLAYCAGGTADKIELARLRVRKIDLTWMHAAKRLP